MALRDLRAPARPQMFPMYGFGGQLGKQATSHCFPMGSGPESTCPGINGMLAAYRQALSTYSLSGPTLFAPVVRMAAQVARATVAARPPKYTVRSACRARRRRGSRGVRARRGGAGVFGAAQGCGWLVVLTRWRALDRTHGRRSSSS